MDETTREDYRWLISEKAEPLLTETMTALMNRVNSVRLIKALRQQTSVNRAALLLEQAQLRIRGRQKFSLADQMFFTRRGLEQATGEPLAQYKARRFSQMKSVADICCGIGGDLMGLVNRQLDQPATSDEGSTNTTDPRQSRSTFHSVGVDADELTGWFASHNASIANSLSDSATGVVRVQRSEYATFDRNGFDAIHCDPDRRVERRTILAQHFSPPLDQLLREISREVPLGIKLAPATVLEPSDCREIEREWIGDRRECKQQLLWRGSITDKPGWRTATAVIAHDAHQFSVLEESLFAELPQTGKLQRFLYEPHPTILAAEMTDAFAAQLGLARIAEGIGYLTGAQLVHHPLLSSFEVIEVLEMSFKKTLQCLRSYDVGTIELKRRGISPAMAAAFEKMKLSGSRQATVFLTRLDRQRIVVVAQRRGGALAGGD